MSAAAYIRIDALGPERRRALLARGADAERFLQGTISGDVTRSKDAAVAATLLTVKGKIISDLVVTQEEDALVLWIPVSCFDDVHARLCRHVIMDEVDFAPADDLVAALVLDPTGKDGIEADYPASGRWVQGPRVSMEAAWPVEGALSPASWAAHRVRAGLPAWSREVVPDVFPPEVGLVRAVSYEKGCYMGQEPLARIHARGQVNRVLVRVRWREDADADGSLPAGLTHPDRPAAGRLTTMAVTDEGMMGLAVVHRSLAVPGTRMQAEPEPGSEAAAAREVEVTSGPIGDDDGVAGRGRQGR